MPELMSPITPKHGFWWLTTFLFLAFAGMHGAQAAPAFQAAGTPVTGTGAVSPAWPAHAVGDIALLFVESTGGQAATLSTAAGFVAVANSPQFTGATTAGTRLSVFWARATSTSMAAPTVADPGDHVYARIITYRGAVPTGDPWDVTGGGIRNGTVTVTGLTTTVANTRIVQAVSRGNDSTAASFSAQTNANLTGITERSDGGTTSGDGGGFVVWDGVKATAGATGDTTTLVSAPSFNAFLTIALLPQGGSAPTYQAAGAAVSGTGAVSPAWPAHATNDIALLFVESRGTQAATLSTAAGFTAVANSPQTTSPDGTGTRLTVFWARATSNAMGAPTVADPGDHVYARIITYRGVTTTGNPWDATAGGVRDGTISLSSITTTVADTLVVQAVSRDNDLATAAFSAQTNANLASIAERADAGTTSGNGGGFAVWDGIKATAGATGITTTTVNVASVNAFLSIALKKPDFPVVSSINLASADPTTTGTAVSWAVTFSQAVSGVDETDFSLVMAGGASGATITSVTGSGTTWTVNANTGSGTGTLGLNLVDDDTIINAGLTPLGGAGAGNGNFTGQVYTVIFTPGSFVFTSSSCLDGVAFGGPGQCALVSWSPQVAGQALASVYITAVNGSNVPTRLHPAQNRTRDMDFGLSCHDPVSNAGMQASFAGLTLPLCQANGATPGTWSATTTVTFLAGVPSSNASYSFNYPDVGSVALWMRNNATPSETGNSGTFVVKPAGFTLSAIQQTAVPNLANPGAANGAGAQFVKAGEAFSVTVTATASGGATTPNYGKETVAEGVKLTVSLVAPGGGASPALVNETAFGSFTAGVATGTTFAWHEVGIITLTPSVGDGSYLGVGDVTGTVTGNVGRFYPDHLGTPLTGPMSCGALSFTPACPSGNYLVYSGQSFPVQVTAYTLGGSGVTGITTNYVGAFARDVTLTAWDDLGSTTLQNPPASGGALTGNSVLAGSFTAGVAAATPVYTFTATPTAPTNVYVRAIDAEGSSSLNAIPANSVEGGIKVVSGRMQIENMYGPLASRLATKARLLYWTGTQWALNTSDTISAAATGNFALGATTSCPLGAPNYCGVTLLSAALLGAGGEFRLVLTPPTSGLGRRSVLLNSTLPYLPASAQETWGSFRAPYIYQRER